MIKIRPATMEDKEAVLHISNSAWNDDEEFDYIANIFDQWVTNGKGDFVVAEYDGKLAGCARLTRLTPQDAWLEGLRVGLEYQGKGIGKALNQYFIAQHTNYKTMRLSTFIENKASIHIMERKGFQPNVGFRIMEATPQNIPLLRPVEALNDLDEVKAFLDASKLQLRQQFLSFDWTFQKLNDQLLQELLQERSVFGTRDILGRVDGLIILSTRHCKGPNLSICYLQANDNYDTLLAFAHQEGHRRGIKTLITMCPADETLQQALQKHGFASFTDDPLNVFVYTLRI